MLVKAKYVSLFIDLGLCRDYSWGAVTLVVLYDNLGDGAIHDTRYLGGYMILLQCWIYEHFPSIYKRGDKGVVPAHLPKACRWIAKHVVECGLMTYRRRLDALLLKDVVFTPYDDDRANHRFFGRIQYITCDVPRVPNNIDWEWQTTMRSFVAVFQSLYIVAAFPREVTTDCYAWYLNISHPLILHPPIVDAPSSPSTAAAHGPSSSVHVGLSSARDRRVAELVRRAIELVVPFSEVHDILSELGRMFPDDD
uniref:Uncharacterized protein LOC101488573 n=1 Tax=Cicer arietinum TaxID=3827 RepID=A0A1S2XJZ9_CICAR|nr:uncharacterized protein LOC101488573 [Cicer arietinum]